MEEAVTARQAARRRRVTVCDPVTGSVSPSDIKAYLVATGWREVTGRRTLARVFERSVGGKRVEKDVLDDAEPDEIEFLIRSLAKLEGRKPSEMLRAIEAHARGEKAVEPAATRRRRRRR